MMIPSTEGMRNVYASVQALGIRSGPPGAIEYNHGKAKFDAWLAAIEREATARAVEAVADELAQPRKLWHGDGGVTVLVDERKLEHQKLGDWLRARAAEIREAKP